MSSVKEETADERFTRLYKENRERFTNMRKLWYDFYELHDAQLIDGNKKKGIPPRKDLQLQRELYRKESIRLGDIAYAMLQKAYVQDGLYKRFRTELFK